MQKIKAKIHLKSIAENAKTFKALTGTKLCAVVKADAYGHGAEEVAFALQGIADCFAVALLSEAKAIKTPACGKDVLVLCPPIALFEAIEMVQNAFVCTVMGITSARLVARASEICHLPARVHLKVNTGMNRYGMGLSELGRVCNFFKTTPNVKVEGLFSHLHDPFGESAQKQRERFLQAERVCTRYYPTITRHLSATAGALLGESFAFDMVRVGIGLYGYLPFGAEKELPLKKGMTVSAVSMGSRKYAYGAAGYGKELSPSEREKFLTILRVGYADGFLRKRENGIVGFEKNAGNLCMDACIQKGKCKRGKEVLVLMDADETAKQTGTISYEVLCSLTRRAEKIYLYD